MLVSASTVKDTVTNLETFVRRNLAAGLDHLVLFLDADQPEIEEHFGGRDDVTCVRAWGPEWWGEDRPDGLNTRQILNVSVANAVLTRVGWASWLFHIDGDEVVRLDRERLERLPERTGVVLLEVLESVSDPDAEAEGGWFKRLLTRDERQVLLDRGLIAARPNRAYFHGHITGKSGWRPTLELRGGVHKPRDREDRPVTGERAPWLQVLHLDSPTATEFARKWRNLVGAGLATMAAREQRGDIGRQVADVLARPLGDDEVEAELQALWRRTTRDPFPELRDLGYLERIDVDEVRYRPRPVPAAGRAELRALLGAAGGTDRRGLHGPHRERVLDQIVAAAGRIA